MRSKIAIGLAILGLLLLALGIGQRTIWLPSDTVTATLAAPTQSAPLTVVDPALLNSHGGNLTLSIKADGPIELAVGRPADVAGWVGSAAHLNVTGANADFTSLETKHSDGDATVPSPVGSDLWVSQRSGTGTMDYQWTPPADGDWAILLSSGGTAPAPTDISVTAPNDTSTPWAVPLMVLGAIALAVAALVFLIKPKQRRRAAGPRRAAGAEAAATITNATGARPVSDSRAGSSTAAGAKDSGPRAADASVAWPVAGTQSIPVPSDAAGSGEPAAGAATSADAPAAQAIDAASIAAASKDASPTDGKKDTEDDTKDGRPKGPGSTATSTGKNTDKNPGKNTNKAPGTSTDNSTGKPGEKGKDKRMTPFSRSARWGAAIATVLVAGSLAPAQADDTTSPAPSASPSASASSTAAATSAYPALVENQFTRILNDVATVVATGDNAKDANELASRVGGSALEIRAANYKIRSQVSSYAAALPVASSKLLSRVVTNSTTWPRTIIAVTQGEGNDVPQVLTMVQSTARENYKLVESTPLLPGQTFPTPAKEGSEQLPADAASALLMSPNEALAGLSDRLTKGDSAWKDKFNDSVYITDTETYQAQFAEKAKDASYAFSHNLVADTTRVLRTADGGAMVVANYRFQVDATANPEAKLTIADEAAVFAGGKETTTGYVLAFGEPVVLYIPPASAGGKMTLLSATRELVDAKFK